MGKTVSQLRSRINGYRALYYRVKKEPVIRQFHIIRTITIYPSRTIYIQEHNCTHQNDFDNFYRFTIVQHCNPSDLDVAEHRWIHRLNTLETMGNKCRQPIFMGFFVFVFYWDFKSSGGFENSEIKGAPFQIRHLIFQGGLDSQFFIKEMHSPGFEKDHISTIFACGGLLFLVFEYFMNKFSNIFNDY